MNYFIGFILLVLLLIFAGELIFNWWLGHQESCPGRFVWSVGPVNNKQESKIMDIKINNLQKISVALTPVNAAGKPAELDPNNPPRWTVQSGDSLVLPSADGKSASLVSSDTPGDTLILVEADADLGDGVENISDVIRLTVEGARAVNLGLTVGAPELK